MLKYTKVFFYRIISKIKNRDSNMYKTRLSDFEFSAIYSNHMLKSHLNIFLTDVNPNMCQ